MPLSCTRVLEFDAGHRVLGHTGKCSHPHGHRYKLEAVAVSKNLNDIGVIIDFSVIKERLGVWLDENWDHAFLVNVRDGLLPLLRATPDTVGEPRVVALPFNPTAEGLAQHLLHSVCPALFAGTGVQIVRIRVYETPNCWADASLPSIDLPR